MTWMVFLFCLSCQYMSDPFRAPSTIPLDDCKVLTNQHKHHLFCVVEPGSGLWVENAEFTWAQCFHANLFEAHSRGDQEVEYFECPLTHTHTHTPSSPPPCHCYSLLLYADIPVVHQDLVKTPVIVFTCGQSCQCWIYFQHWQLFTLQDKLNVTLCQ